MSRFDGRRSVLVPVFWGVAERQSLAYEGGPRALVRHQGRGLGTLMSGVLIVDDDGPARAIIARALAENGLKSVPASSVDDAMELIQSLEPDVILLNASLGPQSALLMQRALRSGGRQAPAVVFTNGRNDEISDIVARVRLAMDRPRF